MSTLCDRHITADEPPLYVSWAQEYQTANAKAAQHPPTAQRTKREQKDHNRARVHACLEDSGALAVRELSVRTGIGVEQVSYALWVLMGQGHVVRSHRQPEDKSTPVTWRVA